MYQRSTPLAILLGLILFFSCDEDQEQGPTVTQKSTVAFKVASTEVHEEGGEIELKLRLSPAAVRNGEVMIKSDRVFSTIFTTTPAASGSTIRIPVEKGDSLAVVRIKPVNNDTYGGDKTIPFYISGTSPEILKGRTSTAEVIVIDDENDTHDPEEIVKSTADFSAGAEVLEESDLDGEVYEIKLSAPAAADGQIRLTLTSSGLHGTHFVITPTPAGNEIVLDVPKGSSSAFITVKPVNNAIVTGETTVELAINATAGAILKGTNLVQSLIIIDDELKGLPKGYETASGNQTDSKWYSYDEQGRLSRVHWRRNETRGTHTYFYNENGQLTKINQAPGTDVHYLYENGRINRYEKVVSGVVKEYSEFDYDDAGNVSGSLTWHLQTDGSYKKGFIGVYLYYTDGNLYKSLIYMDVPDQDEPVLVAARSYENYLKLENPFAIEIIPMVKAQHELPQYYTYEQNDVKTEYHLFYETDEDNRITQRTASSSSDTEATIYHYY